MLKYLGLSAIFIASVLPAFEYSRRVERRCAEYLFFAELAKAIRRQISTYSSPIGSFLSSLHCPLSHIGLKFSDECDFLSDFMKIEDKLSVSDEALRELREFFGVLGTAGRDEEISRAARLHERFKREAQSERERARSSVSTVRAVCCAVGLSVVILFI